MNSFTNKKALASDNMYELIQSSTILLPKKNSEMTSDLFTKAISKQPTLMLCLEVLRERRVEGSRGKESSGEESKRE